MKTNSKKVKKSFDFAWVDELVWISLFFLFSLFAYEMLKAVL